MIVSDTRFAVLLFTDIVGSADLKLKHGVPAYSEALRRHNGHFERLARECRDIRILQNMGDGYFAEAGGIVEAVRFALLFQEAMREGPWAEICLTTRLGIHAGEISSVESEGGSGIVAPAADLAARVMSLALGGQIMLTRLPFDEARHFIPEHPTVEGKTMPPLRWLAHGPYLMKGRDEPVEVFEVGADGLAPLAAPPDGEKAKRAIRPGEEETLGWRPAAGLEIPGRPGWHLIDRLGAGGFGEVWSGEHAKLRKRRAFKFCFDDERLRALKREVTLVRLLRSALGDRDDIVHIHEIKLDEPPFYLESDLAPHGNLLQWAEQQGGLEQIPLERRLSLVARTATALAAAHSIGVLHKDIKPTNILIFDCPEGEPRPRLVDFGISALADSGVLDKYGVTGAGFTRATLQHSTGTPTYSPPEYLAGRPYTIQGDIFGLGVLLYQLVTAKPHDPLAPGWERDIPDPLLREDIAACVDGDPNRRLPSAADLAERLIHLEERRAEIQKKEHLEREAAARAEAEKSAVAARMRASRLRTISVSFAALSLLAIAGGVLAWINEKKAGDALVALERKEHENQLATLRGDIYREKGLEAVDKHADRSAQLGFANDMVLSLLTMADPELKPIRSKWADSAQHHQSQASIIRDEFLVFGASHLVAPTLEQKEAAQANSELVVAATWVRSILSSNFTAVLPEEEDEADSQNKQLIDTRWKRFELALACAGVARSLESPLSVRVRNRGGNAPGLLRQQVKGKQAKGNGGDPVLEEWIQPDNDPMTWRLRAQFLWLGMLLEGGPRMVGNADEGYEVEEADDEAALFLFMPKLATRLGVTEIKQPGDLRIASLLDDLLAWNGEKLDASLDMDTDEQIDLLFLKYLHVTIGDIDKWILERGEPIAPEEPPAANAEDKAEEDPVAESKKEKREAVNSSVPAGRGPRG